MFQAVVWPDRLRGGAFVRTRRLLCIRGTVGVIKSTTDRTQLNGKNTASFLSAHTLNTSLCSTKVSKNIESMGWSDTALIIMRYGCGMDT